MKISMCANLRILKNTDSGFVPIDKNEADSVCIGGFSFDVNGSSIPFDWDAFSGTEENGVFSFETGTGFLFNDYELSDCYDDAYKDMGLNKNEITAEFLASTNHIEEFFIDFIELSTGKEADLGLYSDNASADSPYKLELIDVKFIDIENMKEYSVQPDVIAAFNKGERGKVLSLDEQIGVAQANVQPIVSSKDKCEEMHI